jgi:hypothetical protein
VLLDTIIARHAAPRDGGADGSGGDARAAISGGRAS